MMNRMLGIDNKIIDRSSTARNDIRQSLDVFGKIINSYVGYDAL